MTTKAGSIS